jgi:hypothetical protein
MPLSRGQSFGNITFNRPQRQGSWRRFDGAEEPDSIVYTLPRGMESSEIGDYIEKYKDKGISKNLDVVFRLKNQKEKA